MYNKIQTENKFVVAWLRICANDKKPNKNLSFLWSLKNDYLNVLQTSAFSAYSGIYCDFFSLEGYNLQFPVSRRAIDLNISNELQCSNVRPKYLVAGRYLFALRKKDIKLRRFLWYSR